MDSSGPEDVFPGIQLSDIDLSRLSPDERTELLHLAEHRYGGEGLADYIRRTRPHEAPPPHLMPVIGMFERARRRGRVRACVSMPPRSGKSTTLRSGIAWWLLRTPADTCAYTSYNEKIAQSQSYKIRDEARAVGVVMAPDRQSVNDWGTLKRGGLIAASPGSALTGRGVTGVLVVDDPHKDQRDADSPGMREVVWDWFNRVAMTRLEGHASVIVTHTRWNDDDLISRLTREGGWEIINIKAIAEDDDDLLGRKPGESFWPDRPQFAVSELLKFKQRDEYGFASLYQGKPRAHGARIFDSHRTFTPRPGLLDGCMPIIGVDPAASERKSADYSWAVFLAIRNWNDPDRAEAYVVNALRMQTSVPEFARALLRFRAQCHNARIAVEAVGGFKAVPQLLREAAPGLPLIEISSLQQLHGDKFQRAVGFAGAWNMGRVFVPDNSPPWLDDYLAEISVFTGTSADKQDGAIDASAHAWNTVVGAPRHAPRGAVEVPAAYGAR